MTKLIIAILYLLGLAVLAVSIVLLALSIPGGTTVVNDWGGTIHTPGNLPLFIVAIALIMVALVPLTASWVLTLVKAFSLKRLDWIIGLFLFSMIAIPAYLIAGPTVPASQTGVSSSTSYSSRS